MRLSCLESEMLIIYCPSCNVNVKEKYFTTKLLYNLHIYKICRVLFSKKIKVQICSLLLTLTSFLCNNSLFLRGNVYSMF